MTYFTCSPALTDTDTSMVRTDSTATAAADTAASADTATTVAGTADTATIVAGSANTATVADTAPLLLEPASHTQKQNFKNNSYVRQLYIST